MQDTILVSDFDGTITKIDTLSKFLEDYAEPKWLDIENDWRDGKFGSQECLTKQFALVPHLTPDLIEKFLDTMEIDDGFVPFCKQLKKKNIPIILVGKQFWNEVVNIQALASYGVISLAEARTYKIVETAEEAWAIIAKYYKIK